MKRLLYTTICVLCCIFTQAQNFDSKGLTYSINGDKSSVTVTGYTETPPSNLIIPNTVPYENKEYKVTHIGEHAFFESPEIETIQFSKNLFKIEFAAFSYCQNITHIIFEDGLGIIDKLSFNNCMNLKSIKISKSVKLIGPAAFMECSNLQSIEVDEENENFSSYEGVLYNKNRSELIHCPGILETIDIPNSVDKIGDYAFWQHENIISVSIPNSVTSIGTGAFMECKRLNSLNIPSSISSISNAAFDKSYSIRNIICKDKRPNPYLYNSNIFEDEVYMFATLEIPTGSKANYESSDAWGRFSNIEEVRFNDDVANERISHDENNIKIRTTPNGIYLKSLNNKVITIYNINGQIINRNRINKEQFIYLSSGIYIITDESVVKKITIH